MASERSYRRAIGVVRRLGMDVEDGLGLVYGGGVLVDGTTAPDWIQNANGLPVEHIAEIADRRALITGARDDG